MAEVLFCDDQAAFLELVKEVSRASALGNISFVRSVAEAIENVRSRTYARVVTDMGFESEVLNGLDLFDEVRRLGLTTELVLLTGNLLSESDILRLAEVRAFIVSKANLTSDLLISLLDNRFDLQRLPLFDSYHGNTEAGPIELLRALEDRALSRNLNRALVEDMLEVLNSVEDSSTGVVWLGNVSLTIDQMRQEILAGTPIGVDLVRMHYHLLKHLRGAN
ncbi:MAG: response regulator [Candidatus Zixiibacteriota bacterium]